MDNNLNIPTILDRDTYTAIAERAGVSRNTIYNIRKRPENATLKTLRRVFSAMGYEIVISIIKSDDAPNEIDTN